MSPRYLLVIAEGETDWPELLDRIGRRTGLILAFAHGRFAVFVNASCRCLDAGERACVIGTLFHRHGLAQPIAGLNSSEAAAIAESNGDALLRSFWGGYVAAVAAADSVRIIRDPSGTFPCYFARGLGCAAFASDAELLVESGLAGVDFDWRALARDFFSAGMPAAETALRGISELLPGFAMQFPGEMHQEPVWSPWDHIAEHDKDTDAAAERLSRTVKHCVRAWASGRGKVLVSVSGGLDSSVVAAALADADADATCLTMYAEDPGGDEREFARALCAHLGFPLVERPYRLEDIDIGEPLGAHLPRPRDRTQALAYEHAHLDVARTIGAEAFVTGNGGDSVFGYSQSAAPVADRYLSEGLHMETFRTLLDVCRQTGCSLFDAGMAAWRIARGPHAYRCRPNPLFLDRSVIGELTTIRFDHPWLNAPADALPGKAAHIAWILRVQQSLEPSRGHQLPVLNPLMSQPIIETCLAVPSWQWRAGGRDRSLARRAFAGDLPRVIVERRIKGSPGHFAGKVLDHFRPAIRQRLLDGKLARQRIIDSRAIEEALKGERPCTDEQRVRILELVAAESWLDSWASRGQALSGVEDSVSSPADARSHSSAGPIA